MDLKRDVSGGLVVVDLTDRMIAPSEANAIFAVSRQAPQHAPSSICLAHAS